MESRPATQPGSRQALQSPADRPEVRAPAPPVIDQRAWENAVEDFKKEKPAMASYLAYGVPKAQEQGLIISFNPEYASIAALAKDRLPEIADYLEERFGRDVRVDVVVDESSAAPTATRQRIEQEDRRREKEAAAIAHPLVQKIRSELGASVVGVQLIENQEHQNR
jgi:hypothetical protein